MNGDPTCARCHVYLAPGERLWCSPYRRVVLARQDAQLGDALGKLVREIAYEFPWWPMRNHHAEAMSHRFGVAG